jgi:hypothetical protein
MRRLFGLLVMLACALPALAQARWPKPDWTADPVTCREAGKTLSYPIAKYRVKIVQIPAREIKDYVCRAYLLGAGGSKTRVLDDFDISVHRGTGEDIFDDGNTSLILEGFSGGAHCCWTYSIIDLGERPMILPRVENESPFFSFKDSADGKFKILTKDGAFDYFDGMCHACTPFPSMVLEVREGKLRDASAQFVADYDGEIAEARSGINQGDLGRFLTVADLATNGRAQAESEQLRQAILKVVLSYLFSGREQQAWQELTAMWPANDVQRIKKLIVKTWAQGVLAKIGALGSDPKRIAPHP